MMEKTKYRYCPECKTEYEQEIPVCADCRVTLVYEKPQNSPLKEITWIIVGEFPGKVFSEMAGEILTNNNIPYFLKSDFLTSALNITSVNVPGAVVKLYVPEYEKENAENLLGELVF